MRKKPSTKQWQKRKKQNVVAWAVRAVCLLRRYPMPSADKAAVIFEYVAGKVPPKKMARLLKNPQDRAIVDVMRLVTPLVEA